MIIIKSRKGAFDSVSKTWKDSEQNSIPGAETAWNSLGEYRIFLIIKIAA